MNDHPFPTGWIPDEFDPRDRPLYMANNLEWSRPSSTPESTKSASASAPIVGTGKMVSLRAKCPPVYDQRPLNSCTANAVAAALRYAVVETYGINYEKCDPSRLFVYLNGCRWGADYGKLPTFGKPSTLYEPDPAKELSEDKLYKAPADSWYDARTYIPRVISYYRIVEPQMWHRVIDPQATDAERLRRRVMEPPPVAELQRCIDDGYPFISGLYFYPSANFNGVDHIDADGVFRPPPTSEEGIISTHAVLAIGYDAFKRRFLIQNSWGTTEWPFPSWSNIKPRDEKMRGYCWMPYEWFEPGAWKYSSGPAKGRTATFTSDFWVIKVPDGAPVDKAAPRVRAGGEPWLPKSLGL